MSIVYEQPVPDRGGPNDPEILERIADAVISRVGSSFTTDVLRRSVTASLSSAYVVVPRVTIPNPVLYAGTTWQADVSEHEMRTDDGDPAEYHLAIARAHLALAGAKTDTGLLDAWQAIYSMRDQWANRLAPGHEYNELKHETREAVDALINAGIEP